VRKSDTGVYTWKMDPAVRRPNTTAPPRAPWDAYAAIACPALVVRGALSDVLSGETARRMVETLPGAQLVEVPGVGHAPSLVEPEAIGALRAFLGRA
jgi:pimeloyl-ACP methyl ester carboxylesterase